MAFTCGFFNSENGDRKYNAEQMSAIFDGIIADGVFTTIGDHMVVSAGTGMQVLVGTGKAWFDHTWNVNDAAYPLAIAASDVTLSRIDAIVLETNHSDSVRLNKLRVVQGTVASSPVKPTLTNSEKVHQHPLAWVTVAPGVTQIAASAIENAVGTSACPFVTGIIATTAIDDLFNQWNGEFDEWFNNLKAQLSDNVVANLQKQIDANKMAIDNDVVKKVSKDSVGHIVNQASPVQPDNRYLECDGSTINSTVYPELWSLTETSINFNSPLSEKDVLGSIADSMASSVGRFFKFEGKICKFVGPTTMVYTSDGVTWSKKVFSSLSINANCRIQVFENELVALIPTKGGFKIWHWPSFSGSASTITIDMSDILGSKTSIDPSGIGYINGKYVVLATQSGSSSIVTLTATTDDWRTDSGWSINEIPGYPNLGFAYGYGPVTINNNMYFVVFARYPYDSRGVYLIYTANGTTFSYKKLNTRDISDDMIQDGAFYSIDYYNNDAIYMSLFNKGACKITMSDDTIAYIGPYYNYIHDLNIGMVKDSKKSTFSPTYSQEIVNISIETDTIGYSDDLWRISETLNGECRMGYFDSVLYVYTLRDSTNAGTSYQQGFVQAFNVGKFLPYIISPSHHFIKAKEDF